MKALIVGGGAAGAAACYALGKRGAACTWLWGSPGASQMSCGAVDGAKPCSEAFSAFNAELGLYAFGTERARVVTRLGEVRAADGVDRAILDVGNLSRQRVGILSLPWLAWDAGWLARSLNATAWSRTHAVEWVVVSLPHALPNYASRVAASEFAELLDAHAQSMWDAMRQARSKQQLAAWLFPPSCFADVGQLERWREQVGVPVGESLSSVSDLAGVRFDRARQAWAARQSNLTLERTRVRGVVTTRVGVEITTDSGIYSGDVAVLATGSWVGGGLKLTENNRLELSYSLEGAEGLRLSVEGRPFSSAAEWGVTLTTDTLSRLERVGLSALPAGPVAPRIVAAGAACADLEPTLGAAIESGLAAADGLYLSHSGSHTE